MKRKAANKERAPAPEVHTPAVSVKIQRTWKDYLWLLCVILAIAAVIIFWPLWHYLVGADEDNYFSVLGVQEGADKGVIKRAYRQLARQWHPDHNPGCGQQCRDRMRAVQEAYQTLLSGDGNNRQERGEKNENGLNNTLLHLFLGRLFEVGILAGEFFISLIPLRVVHTVRHFRTAIVGAAFAAMYFHLGSVQVSLSYIGMGVCVYRWHKLPTLEPGIRHTWQFWEFLFFVLPAFASHFGTTVYLSGFQATLNNTRFWLNTAAGLAALGAWMIRASFLPIVFTYRLKRVGPVSTWLALQLLREIATNDLLLHLIKIPAPYRVMCLLAVVVALWQRWIYPVMSLQYMKNYASIHGIDSGEVQQTTRATNIDQTMKQQQHASQSTPQDPTGTQMSAEPPRRTEAGPKLTKQEKKERQRQSGEQRSAPNYGLWCMLFGMVVFVLLMTLGPWLITQFSDGSLLPTPVKRKTESPNPTGEHERYNYENARKPGDKPKTKTKTKKGTNKKTKSKAQ